MADITQTLGFEAAQAIATLGQLKSALSGVNTQLRAMNKAVAASKQSNVIQGFGAASNAAQKLQNQVGQTGNALQQAGNKGKTAASSISLSWGSMLKIVGSQVAFKAINALGAAFTDTAQKAHDFEIQAAQISALSSGPGSSIDELRASIAALSVELGRDVGETGAALFETVQNDIADTVAESEEFVKASSQLALIFGGELSDGVNALTSVLKVYGLEVDQVTQVNDAFVVAIDKGRLKLDELADSLGTVLPLAKPLGLGFDESAASIAALTQSGLNSATAMTQLRNILQKLVVPTKGLQASFTQLGVASGAELIEKFGGLSGALIALKGSVGGNDQALASMFGTIRGQLGVFNLLSNDAAIVNDIMDAMRNKAGRAQEAFEKIEGTEAREADKAWAQFNATLTKVGETTLRIQTGFVQAVNTMLPSAQTITTAIGALGAAFLVMGANAAFASGVATVALAAIAPHLIALAALTGLAFLAFKQYDIIANWETLEKSIQKARVAQENYDKSTAKATAARYAAEEAEKWKEREAAMSGYFDKATQKYNNMANVAKAANERITQSITNALGNIEQIASNALETIKSTASGVGDILDASNDRIKDFQDQLDDINFNEETKNMNANQKLWYKQQQAMEDSAKALKEYQKALGDPEASKQAADNLQEVIDQLAEIEKEAGSNSYIGQQAAAERKKLLEGGIGIERAGQDVIQEQLALSGKEASTALKQLEDAAKSVALALPKLLSPLNEDGSVKSPDNQQEDLQAATDITSNFNKAFNDAANNPLVDALGLGDDLAKAMANFGFTVQDGQVDWANSIGSLEQGIANADLVPQIQSDNKIVQGTLDDVNSQYAAGSDPVAQIKAQQEAMRGLITTQQNAKDVVDQTGQSLADQTTRFQGLQKSLEGVAVESVSSVGNLASIAFTSIFDSSEAASAQIKRIGEQSPVKAIVDEMKAAPEAIAEAGVAELAALQTQAEGFKKTIGDLKASGEVSADGAGALDQGTEILLDMIETRKSQIAAEGVYDEEAKQDAQNFLDILIQKAAQAELFKDTSTSVQAVGQVTTAVGATTTQAQATNTAINTMPSSFANAAAGAAPAIAAMNQLKAAAVAAAQAVAAASSGGSGGVATAYHGGKINYRAVGGPISRGQDTQLTALALGERVINQRASSMFASELQAMNAMQRPQFRDKGGPTTNIGDIHVSVNGGQPANGAATGHDIAIALRRELRRKTSQI